MNIVRHALSASALLRLLTRRNFDLSVLFAGTIFGMLATLPVWYLYGWSSLYPCIVIAGLVMLILAEVLSRRYYNKNLPEGFTGIGSLFFMGHVVFIVPYFIIAVMNGWTGAWIVLSVIFGILFITLTHEPIRGEQS